VEAEAVNALQKGTMSDLRDEILSCVANKRVVASIIADDGGTIAGTQAAREEAERLGLFLETILDEGTRIKQGDEIARFWGSPKQVVIAEDVLMGLMAKPSGIATAAREFVKRAGLRPKIVSGAWKKMPLSLKNTIREAVVAGGAFYRISHDPFIYLDKNYIRILGGITESLKAVEKFSGYQKVVQLRGRYKDIAGEACEAAESGATILFIDTGQSSDVKVVVEKLLGSGLRNRVKIAFGGDIRLEHIDELKALDIDALDIGRQILDAPLLDMRLEVIEVSPRTFCSRRR